jgi:hypothetical protein
MADYQIFLIGGDDDESGLLSTNEDAERCHISFTYRGRMIKSEADDYFEALCSIRLQLEGERLMPFCYGASLKVYPSGMARDMGAGLKAYKLEVGKNARRQDLVDIVAAGPDVIPASVKLQREFYEEWLASPKA